VPLLSSIVELLRRERIPYTCFRHVPAYTALEEAAVSHTLERCWAKVVICIADDQPVQAVLQADHIADLEELRRLANADVLRLAGEDEIAVLWESRRWSSTPARTQRPSACIMATSPSLRSPWSAPSGGPWPTETPRRTRGGGGLHFACYPPTAWMRCHEE